MTGKALNDGKSIGPTHTLSVKTHLFTDKLLILSHLSVRCPLFTDKLMIGVNLCLKNCSADSGGEVKGIRAKVLEKFG